MLILEMHRRDRVVRMTQKCWYLGRNYRSSLGSLVGLRFWSNGLIPWTGKEWCACVKMAVRNQRSQCLQSREPLGSRKTSGLAGIVLPDGKRRNMPWTVSVLQLSWIFNNEVKSFCVGLRPILPQRLLCPCLCLVNFCVYEGMMSSLPP